ARALRQVALDQLPVRAGRQARVAHAGDGRMAFEEPRDAERVRDVTLHPQGKRLEAEEEEERVERRERSTEVAQRLRAELHEVAVHPERFVGGEAVVRRRWVGATREAAGGPGERAGPAASA